MSNNTTTTKKKELKIIVPFYASRAVYFSDNAVKVDARVEAIEPLTESNLTEEMQNKLREIRQSDKQDWWHSIFEGDNEIESIVVRYDYDYFEYKKIIFDTKIIHEELLDEQGQIIDDPIIAMPIILNRIPLSVISEGEVKPHEEVLQRYIYDCVQEMLRRFLEKTRDKIDEIGSVKLVWLFDGHGSKGSNAVSDGNPEGRLYYDASKISEIISKVREDSRSLISRTLCKSVNEALYATSCQAGDSSIIQDEINSAIQAREDVKHQIQKLTEEKKDIEQKKTSLESEIDVSTAQRQFAMFTQDNYIKQNYHGNTNLDEVKQSDKYNETQEIQERYQDKINALSEEINSKKQIIKQHEEQIKLLEEEIEHAKKMPITFLLSDEIINGDIGPQVRESIKETSDDLEALWNNLIGETVWYPQDEMVEERGRLLKKLRNANVMMTQEIRTKYDKLITEIEELEKEVQNVKNNGLQDVMKENIKKKYDNLIIQTSMLKRDLEALSKDSLLVSCLKAIKLHDASEIEAWAAIGNGKLGSIGFMYYTTIDSENTISTIGKLSVYYGINTITQIRYRI